MLNRFFVVVVVVVVAVALIELPLRIVAIKGLTQHRKLFSGPAADFGKLMN